MNTVRSPETSPGPPEDSPDSGRRSRWSLNMPSLSHAAVIWLLIVLLIPASRLVSSSFPSISQIENILVLGSFLAVVAYGQGLVVLSGGLDLSLPAIVTAAGVFAAAYVQNGGDVVVGSVLALLVAVGIGITSGIGVAYLRIPPIVMTIATGSIVGGALLGLNAGQAARPAPKAIQDIFGTDSHILNVPTLIWAFAGFVVLAIVLQHLTVYGRRIYAIGSNELAAHVSGIRVKLLTASVYGVAGLCYGIAGLMLVGYSSGANLSLGDEYLLPAIAAVVVGGTSIKGGRGTCIGVVGGALLLTTVANDISATSLAEGWKQVLYGVIVLGALLLSGGKRLQLRSKQISSEAPDVEQNETGEGTNESI